MFRILANNIQNTFALNNFAFRTTLFYRCWYFHNNPSASQHPAAGQTAQIFWTRPINRWDFLLISSHSQSYDYTSNTVLSSSLMCAVFTKY